ncbi:MAG TPA: LPS biosynthesis protein WbpP [Cytophagales bacterium]|nr:LPS biosynthesis protein WbpP [Cytophagales bacterium]
MPYTRSSDLSQHTFLVTGGAGFIGSHLLDLLVESNAKKVVVLDNYSTGRKENIEHFASYASIEWVQGDITQLSDCQKVCIGIDVVIHLAALGSVPRSIANPIATHATNSTGFLNILLAANENGVKKVIYASSSSVYGDEKTLPKTEGKEGRPLSPYAFTKQSNEMYAAIFGDLYGLPSIGLRFFNIFGERQSKEGPYAAFIPLAIQAAVSGGSLRLFGDGTQSRDFTHVSNVIWAMICAVMAQNQRKAMVFNVACGKSTSLLEIVKYLEVISGNKIQLFFKPSRKGDMRNSIADISQAQKILQFSPICDLREGLKKTYEYFLLKTQCGFMVG